MNLTLITEKLTPFIIAQKQLDTSIELFFTGSDFVSALTIAGAAEEILGKLLVNEGKLPVLERLDERNTVKGSERRKFFNIYNLLRNSYKHLNDKLGYISTNYYAAEMIERAACNYRALTGTETNLIIKFRNTIYPDIDSEEALSGKIGFAPSATLSKYLDNERK